MDIFDIANKQKTFLLACGIGIRSNPYQFRYINVKRKEVLKIKWKMC